MSAKNLNRNREILSKGLSPQQKVNLELLLLRMCLRKQTRRLA